MFAHTTRIHDKVPIRWVRKKEELAGRLEELSFIHVYKNVL